MGISVLDLSSYVGLVAVAAVTLNMVLGIMMAFRYSPVRSWPHRRFNYYRLHNWMGYIALAASMVLPALLLLNKKPVFRLRALLFPGYSPSQPLENTLGAVALYLLAFVVLTSYFRLRLGRRLWKAFHFGIYVAAIPLFFHSLLTDPNLKNSVDWLDGVKIFIELALLAIVVLTVLRFRKARIHL